MAASRRDFFHNFIQYNLLADAVVRGPNAMLSLNAHREWIRFLEHHANPFAQVIYVNVVINIHAVKLNLSGDFAALYQIIHAVEGFEQSGILPHPDGPMNAEISFSAVRG